ncbi:MAG: DNA primase [Bacillota bacterium]
MFGAGTPGIAGEYFTHDAALVVETVPRLADEFIEEVRSRNDIVDVVSDYLPLKKAGRNYLGLCPFHHEKTPSFTVAPEKQIFHCFGCQTGGNVFKFIMLKEGVTFVEAVRLLADRVGLPFQEELSPEDARRQKARDRLFAINAAAAQYYQRLLADSSTAAAARAYLEQRGLSQETVARFALGYAPDSWEALTGHLIRQGYCPEELVKLGLTRRGPKGFYDYFRHRIIFPIRDGRGRVIGFGGRVLDDSSPKYLNSQETPLFAKGKNLYALDLAKDEIRNQGQAIIVEGYMDAISLHQHGIINVVASLGTALTHDQAGLLLRFAPEVIMAYDSDAAGTKATVRGLEVVKEAGLGVRVVNVPDGKDPDDFVRKQGPEAFRRLVEGAVDLPEYRFRLACRGSDLRQVKNKVKVVQEMVPILATMTNAVERDSYLGRFARELGVSEDAFRAELRKYVRANSAKASGHRKLETRNNIGAQPLATYDTSAIPRARLVAEEELIRLASAQLEVLEEVSVRLGKTPFAHPVHQAIWSSLADLAAEGRPVSAAKLLDRVEGEEEIYRTVTRIFTREVEYSLSNPVDTLLETIRRYQAEERMQELTRLIGERQQQGLDCSELLRELMECRKQVSDHKAAR